ncbi:MAG: acetate--CoA ligase family protein [Clostridiales bacterium]|nr:acetate--CoA ligase family protein [Clostridiales bacterium]
MDILKLLKPNRICIVGASEKVGFGGDTCRNVMHYMQPDRYFFVNPKYPSVFGVKCYPSMSDVPQAFDLAVICTPMGTVEDLLREAHKCGAGAAIVYASGYKETGTADGIAAQNSLKALCEELGMALLGPNCAGYVNYIDMVYPFAFIAEERDRRGSVGFVSQSGQLCLSMMENPASTFSYSISVGNCAVTSVEDFVDFLVDDEDTRVLAIYLEGLSEPQRFVNALRRAAQQKKPVVILKAGRSEKGSRVAASHTGSLAGSDSAYDALFEKFGVIRVNDLEELIYTAEAFATLKKLPESSGVASMNLSGGETGICADVGSLCGISFPDFEAETVEALRKILPFYAHPANPLDMTATLSYDIEGFASALRIVMQDPNVSLISIGYTLLENITDPAIHYMAKAIEIVSAEENSVPMLMLPFAGNTRNSEYLELLRKCGVPVLPPPLYGFRIIQHICKFAEFDISKVDTSSAIPTRSRRAERIALSEHEGKLLFASRGIRVPEEEIALSCDHAVEIAKRIGFPVVLKIMSPQIQHKTEVKGVELNLRDETAVRLAYDRIMQNVNKLRPDAYIEGILVQRMAPIGTEVIVGINNDPQLGPCVLVGMGGVFVEVFRDVQIRLAPVSETEALDMLSQLKADKLLAGYRGYPPCDREALAKLIVAVSEIAVEYKDSLVELDINPVFVYEKGVCAVDALIVFDECPQTDRGLVT